MNGLCRSARSGEISDMKNDKLEREARIISEEKGLPYEFIKGMLEFMERKHKPMFSKQADSRPIPEKLTLL